jgi:DNA-binding IclR family transcriptional regulator
MPRQARSALVALDIVEQLQLRAGAPVGVSELSRTIGVNKATTHTVLRMLQLRGYAVQDPETRLFRRGPALWSLGVALTGMVNPVELARNELETFCRSANVNGSVSRHLGNGTMQVILHVGGSFDDTKMFRYSEVVPFPSGVASVYLAWEDPAEVDRIHELWRASAAAPEHPQSLASYQAELVAIRGRGYHVGQAPTPFPDLLICYSEAPVFDEHGHATLVVTITSLMSVQNPTPRYYPDDIQRIARTITRAIGGREPSNREAAPAVVAG